ncbi:hypothetical protein SELMODRAFT_80828 [Selaginella moellendorffii]|uniref:SGNH hydrolase-type esterase domain-containing protein n=1 Tax=Selaginella moellendorffii TaxID=88036 RepID=D8QY08_SELML|nr:hypothetical protein SELMODRAFT_80828 [Selaginella moellendorffii]
MGSHSSTLLLLCVANLVAYASALQYFPNLSTRKVPGLFVLGDSTVDAGNNLYISNPIVEVSVPPYGDTYFGHPTGRYTNGRTLPDFLATSLGLRFPDPYLKPDKWIAQGVNFASGGAGLLESTNAGEVILNTQLAQFHNLTLARPNPEFYKESVFIFSMGANDIMGNYLADSTLQTQVTPQEFIGRMLGAYISAIKALYSDGARRIITLGLPPLGCIPRARLLVATTNGNGDTNGCFKPANDLALAFNEGLAQTVKSLSEELKDTKIVLAKTYDLTMSAIKFPQAFGYEDVKSACCGAGPFNAAVFCGDSYLKNDARTKQFQPYLCPTPSKSMFWDSIHPTEKSYWLYFRYMWYGDDNVVEPYNLAKLFEGAYIPQPPLPIHSSCLV